MPTIEQIRAARALIGWSQSDLAENAEMSQTGIARIENGTNHPNSLTMEKIRAAFDKADVEFIEDTGVKKRDIVRVYEGDGCYLRILDEILRAQPNFVLFSGADERRSTQKSIDHLSKIRKLCESRSLIRYGDTHVMGELDEYRWMPEGLFVDGDVKVIYENTVVHFMSWMDPSRAIKIVDKNIAQESIRMFNYIWDGAEKPSHSTSEIFYD